jgi:hypothetical protein
MNMNRGERLLIAFDLAASLAGRLFAVTNAIANAAKEGRDDLTAAELVQFTAADDAARVRLDRRIEQARLAAKTERDRAGG